MKHLSLIVVGLLAIALGVAFYTFFSVPNVGESHDEYTNVLAGNAIKSHDRTTNFSARNDFEAHDEYKYTSGGARDYFTSEKELKEKVQTQEWLSCSVNGKTYYVCVIPLIAAGRSRERVVCWVNDHRGRIVNVYDAEFCELGPVKVEIDKTNSVLNVIAVANTPYQGKVVASVILTTLGW